MRSYTSSRSELTRPGHIFYELLLLFTSIAGSDAKSLCDYKYYWQRHPGDDCTSSRDNINHNITDAGAYATPENSVVSTRSIMIIFLISLAWILAVCYACRAAKHQRDILANEPSRRPSTMESSEERAEKVRNALNITKYTTFRKEEDQRFGSRKCTHTDSASVDVENDIESQVEVIVTDSDGRSFGGDAVDAVICSICLCPYQAHDKIASSKNDCCNHVYHADCLMLWLSKKDVCPMCRNDMLQLEGKSKGEEGT